MGAKQLVLEIRGNSLDDGPGIRSVVFFKGCPLSCVWCHNPESRFAGPEISFDGSACVACDACRAACPEGALNRSLPGYVDRGRCTLCFRCADVCPSGALSPLGRPMDVEEILRAVLRDRPFFDTSGGGVTLSGGEPMVHMEFAGELLAAFKKEKIGTLVETCGFFAFERFEKHVLPHVDMIYYDIKIVDRERHIEFCGVPNDLILENFSRLLALSQKGGPALLARTPLVPGITDTKENLSAIASFLASLGVGRAKLLAYNPLWHDKNLRIGKTSDLSTRNEMKKWMNPDHVRQCQAFFLDRGISVE